MEENKELQSILNDVSSDDKNLCKEVDYISANLVSKLKEINARGITGVQMMLFYVNANSNSNVAGVIGDGYKLIDGVVDILSDSSTKESKDAAIKLYELLINMVLNAARKDNKKLIYLLGATKQMVKDKMKDDENKDEN